MRELKFRAWDKKHRHMIPATAVHDLFRIDSYVYASVPKGSTKAIYRINGGNLFRNEDLEFMQYTDLKDKNGVEIYEGDIIRCDKCDGQVSEIKWYDGKSDFMGQLGWNLIATEAEATEVIGNIHENPELLR